MDIGKKLRDARNAAGLTQESAAESLGVSRQTVSNWETGKTYPDIVSVIRMSGLYSVSLDCLLKEEKTVSNDLNYLNYLEESTNVVKSRRRLGKLVLVAAYLVIWGRCRSSFSGSPSPGRTRARTPCSLYGAQSR